MLKGTFQLAGGWKYCNDLLQGVSIWQTNEIVRYNADRKNLLRNTDFDYIMPLLKYHPIT